MRTHSLGDHSAADLADVEHGGGLDLVPDLLGERIDNFTLGALLAALVQTFILANSHCECCCGLMITTTS